MLRCPVSTNNTSRLLAGYLQINSYDEVAGKLKLKPRKGIYAVIHNILDQTVYGFYLYPNFSKFVSINIVLRQSR